VSLVILVKVFFSLVFLTIGYDCIEWAVRRFHDGAAWRFCLALALMWFGVAIWVWV